MTSQLTFLPTDTGRAVGRSGGRARSASRRSPVRTTTVAPSARYETDPDLRYDEETKALARYYIAKIRQNWRELDAQRALELAAEDAASAEHAEASDTRVERPVLATATPLPLSEARSAVRHPRSRRRAA